MKLNVSRKPSDPTDLNLQQWEGQMPNVDELLKYCTNMRCSDLYIKVGQSPYINRWGIMHRVPTYPVTGKIWNDWAHEAITSENNAKYVRNRMLDLSYTVPVGEEEYRYRVSAGFSMGKNIATFRMITRDLPSFRNLQFPEKVRELLHETLAKHQGIMLMVGVTGSGKSLHELQTVYTENRGPVVWKNLQVGDRFVDGSTVLETMGWEMRPCYLLTAEDGEELIASDDHLVQCLVEVKPGFMTRPSAQYGVKVIEPWMAAEFVYENVLAGRRILLLQLDGSRVPLRSVKRYADGALQRVRCIRTDTGYYGIGPFVNHNTTTLAACMNDFTQSGKSMDNTTIISLEDPIEYIIPPTPGVNVLQKELGVDFREFALGVKQALREHPTFVNVGETRDRETIETLVEAARTGHGVVSSYHASDVADTISRMYNMLAGVNEGIMYDVIANLNMILCQRLVPSETGFKLMTQYMVFTDEIKGYLNREIAAGHNIPIAITGLMKNPKLVGAGIVRDWQ